MQVNPKALTVLVGFGVLVAMAVSSNGGVWFHVGEAVSSIVILAGLAGLLNEGRSKPR